MVDYEDEIPNNLLLECTEKYDEGRVQLFRLSAGQGGNSLSSLYSAHEMLGILYIHICCEVKGGNIGTIDVHK